MRLTDFLPQLQALLLLVLFMASLPAAEPPPSPRKSPTTTPPPATDPLKKSVAKAVASVVVISPAGSDGKSEGMGTGFVISDDGLIATCLHVIGEGRQLQIRTRDGKALEPVEIHAWDRRLDLAILRVRDKTPQAIPLAPDDGLAPGDEVAAIGNPMGLEYSVVRGVASASRAIEGVELIQVAIPIEPGNSGGPLVDREGRTVGVMALKSAMTANLGFAVPVEALRRLLERPNPVSIERWLNMGALDPAQWETRLGGIWRQRVDRIVVEQPGTGFGGRSLCLARKQLPEGPFEIEVTVRLDDEAGAAGLMFGSDGGDRHYGFYPTGGQLRLTRFDGPDVFSWTILQQGPSDYYRRGEWNRIKVTHSKGVITCYVNGRQVFVSEDAKLAGLRAGLCKFRSTKAEFKRFSAGAIADNQETGPATQLLAEVDAHLKNPTRESQKRLTEFFNERKTIASQVLDARTEQLERDVAQLRRLATQAHAALVGEELKRELTAAESEIDLVMASLWVAKLDDPELDIQAYKAHFDRLVLELRSRLVEKTDARQKVRLLKDFFFKDQGFHGSRHNYYDRENSYLHRVLEHREGIPLSLSVLFLELGQRSGVEGLRPHPLPGHFMVALKGDKNSELVMDVFEGGRELNHAEVDLAYSPQEPRSETLEPGRKRDIVLRMIRNLRNSARGEEGFASTLRYLDLLIHLQPSSAPDRIDRARARVLSGDLAGAKEDLKWLADHAPPGVDAGRVEELLKSMEQ